MQTRELITGPNFSGRSRALRVLLREPGFAPHSFFIGPYAEAALSGLSSTLADEIGIYRADGAQSSRPVFLPVDFVALADRKPQTLSGGEQVLLALHCFSQSTYRAIAIDTALEQLDGEKRTLAINYLDGGYERGFSVALIDNRIESLPSWSHREQTPAGSAYSANLPALTNELLPHQASAIAIHDLHFGYRRGRTIFQGANATLEPGIAHRLQGPNGAGKTTLFKILVGVLSPLSGRILLNGERYEPARAGNRAIALAAQNPDHQWCGATLREDISRRRAALSGRGTVPLPSDERIASLSRALGFPSLDVHLYELPLAARKRLSWLWPFSGALPWIMLDEPTIGQDRETRLKLATVIRRLCSLGYGFIVVTHDDDFAADVPHRALTIEGLQIRTS
jgi:energy-coupling factor transporter ATP-binding protein EcfA2